MWAVFAKPRARPGDTPPGAAMAALRVAAGRLGWLVVGGGAAAGAGIGWFAWKGALGAMWECAVEFTGAYAQMGGNPFEAGWYWFTGAGHWKAVAILGLTACGIAVRRKDGGIPWGAVFAVAWLVAMGDIVGGHYYIMALPPAAMLAGAGMDCMVQRSGRGVWRGAMATAGIVAVLMAGGEGRALRYTPSRLVREMYGGEPFAEAEEAGRVVTEMCPEGGTVHVIGSEPEILWYARRKCATRFDIAYPLTLPTRFAAAFQKEAARALEERRPDVAVFVRTAGGFGGREVMVQPPFGWYLGTMAGVVFGGDYELERAHMPGRDGGWVQGGKWEGRMAEEADLGIWRLRGKSADGDFRISHSVCGGEAEKGELNVKG